MQAELLKYKHYLILLFALIVIKFAIVPMQDNLSEIQLQFYQTEKRLTKVQSLIADKEQLLVYDEQQFIEVAKAEKLIHMQNDESRLKLAAQNKVESVLRNAGCEIEQIAWKGSSQINPQFKLWQLDTRYKGGAPCLLEATRQIEKLVPLIRIKAYSYGAKQITKGKHVKVTANLELIMWQYTKEES